MTRPSSRPGTTRCRIDNVTTPQMTACRPKTVNVAAATQGCGSARRRGGSRSRPSAPPAAAGRRRSAAPAGRPPPSRPARRPSCRRAARRTRPRTARAGLARTAPGSRGRRTADVHQGQRDGEHPQHPVVPQPADALGDLGPQPAALDRLGRPADLPGQQADQPGRDRKVAALAPKGSAAAATKSHAPSGGPTIWLARIWVPRAGRSRSAGPSPGPLWTAT